MTAAVSLMTAAEFWSRPPDGHRSELVRGEVRMMPPSGSGHGSVIMALAGPLAVYVRSRGLGVVFGAETGFVIGQNPDTVRAPDIAFVTRDRIPPEGIPDRYWPGPPTLAVEVVSPNDTVYAVEEKTQDWLDAGAAAVWVVSPKTRTVTVHVRGVSAQSYGEGQTLNAGGLVPGFSIPVAEIFRF